MQKPDLSTYPDSPGVYLYKNAKGTIIYVGKARRLRRRIASYFRPEQTLPVKTKLMLQQATTLDILNTSTENEALLLEASLIKKHRPRYNILLRDDKEYLLFRIDTQHPYPRVEIIRHNARRRRKDGIFFGPFSSGTAARETWRLIHRYFPLRRCRDRAFTNRTRPCLYYDIHQCLAPCVLPVPKETYAALLQQVSLLLSGRSRDLIKQLRQKMLQASEQMRYEDAARLRDQLNAVERTVERQVVVLDPGTDLDLIGIAQTVTGLALGIVFVRDGLLLDGRTFFWPALTLEDSPELLYSFLSQFYISDHTPTPPRIVVPWLPSSATDTLRTAYQDSVAPAWETSIAEDAENWTELFADIQEALSQRHGAPIYLSTPRSINEDNLVALAATNAKEEYNKKATPALPDLLSKRLHTATPIHTIEMVDISHTGGRQTKAGMVVFVNGEAHKSAYRIYNLDNDLAKIGAEPGDDYAALSMWAHRRAKAGPPWPDLILIDGGKGQLSAVAQAFSATNIEDHCTLASIAKARTEEGKADRRAGNVSDSIFLAGRQNPVPFPAGSPELLFLQRVRDAAHDFVLGRHRQARKAATLAGELTRLPGIGPHLAKVLLQQFGSLADLANATKEDLQQVPGIGKVKAEQLHSRLQLLVK